MSNEKEKAAGADQGPAPEPKAESPKLAPAPEPNKALEKRLKAAEADNSEMRKLLETLMARLDQAEAKKAAPVPAAAEASPAPDGSVVRLTIHSRSGGYLLRNPSTEKVFAFAKMFPGLPAAAKDQHDNNVNINHFENGEKDVTFYRGFFATEDPAEVEFFRSVTAAQLPNGRPNPKYDFNLRIAKEEVVA